MSLNRNIFLIIIILIFTSCIENDGNYDEKIISKVDHIIIKPDNPEALFDFLANELKLPVFWDYAQHGDYTSGGIFCGNVNIESLSYDQMENENVICGIAFDPESSTEETLAEFEKRNIAHGDPVHSPVHIVTPINGLLPEGIVVLCDYIIPEKIKNKKKLKQKELEESDGGPLGIEYVITSTIHVNGDHMIKEWKKLIHIEQISSTDYVYTQSSPDIHFIKSDRNGIESIMFKVKSLERVRSYLVENNMFGSEADGIILISPETSHGVLFRFTDHD